MKKHWYRMMENGNQSWIGTAHDEEHAEERCFWDDQPYSQVRYTLERWTGKKWVAVYKDKAFCLN